MCVCFGDAELRLANGVEDRLHLNDVIISDTASCNQGLSALREFRREVLCASVDRRSVEAVVSFVFFSPPVVTREEKHKEG